MGYYTHFSLEVENEDNFSREELIKASQKLAEITDIEDPSYITNDCHYPFSWVSIEPMKWYDWDRDMSELALLFPEMIFCLWGEGEEREDTWRCYFKGDKTEFQRATISYGHRPEWSY